MTNQTAEQAGDEGIQYAKRFIMKEWLKGRDFCHLE
jgi:hypothetical protein